MAAGFLDHGGLPAADVRDAAWGVRGATPRTQHAGAHGDEAACARVGARGDRRRDGGGWVGGCGIRSGPVGDTAGGMPRAGSCTPKSINGTDCLCDREGLPMPTEGTLCSSR